MVPKEREPERRRSCFGDGTYSQENMEDGSCTRNISRRQRTREESKDKNSKCSLRQTHSQIMPNCYQRGIRKSRLSKSTRQIKLLSLINGNLIIPPHWGEVFSISHIFLTKLGLENKDNRYALKDMCFTYHAYFCKRINRCVPRLIKSEEKATRIVSRFLVSLRLSCS